MPSPFPGMDPWLEGPGVFPDLHNTFIGYLREALSVVLPPPYYTALGTRVLIEGHTVRSATPDVDVLRPVGSNGTHGLAGGGGVATAVQPALDVEPVLVHVEPDELTEWLIEVRTGPGDAELVTSIEVLSPSNKLPGDDRFRYERKQRELLERGVHLVEIDLLRSGPHGTAVPRWAAVRKTGPFDYHVCVTRADRRGDYEVYPIRVPQRLPTIRVPLRGAAVAVGLQPVLDRCYDVGQYNRRVRYANPCDPPLTQEQQAWAADILRAKGLIP